MRCLLIPGAARLGIMREDPAVALLFLRRLATRVRGLVERLDQVAGQAVVERLATWVLRAAEQDETRPFTLGMTQAQRAEELGTVRAIRGLAQLRADGAIVTVGRGRFRVRDWSALRTIAAG